MSEPFEEDVGLPSERAKEQAEKVRVEEAILALANERRNGEPLADVVIAARVGRTLGVVCLPSHVAAIRARMREEELLAMRPEELAPVQIVEASAQPTPTPAAEVTTTPEPAPEKPKRGRRRKVVQEPTPGADQVEQVDSPDDVVIGGPQAQTRAEYERDQHRAECSFLLWALMGWERAALKEPLLVELAEQIGGLRHHAEVRLAAHFKDQQQEKPT